MGEITPSRLPPAILMAFQPTYVLRAIDECDRGRFAYHMALAPDLARKGLSETTCREGLPELPGIFFARLFHRKPQDSRCHSAA
jgi:hypothetical protein